MEVGGAQKVVLGYAQRLNREKFDVTVLSIYRSNSVYEKELEDSGVRFICISDKLSWLPILTLQKLLLKIFKINLLKREINKINPDIIHLHLPILQTFEKLNINNRTAVFFTLHSDIDRWEHSHPKEVKCLDRLAHNYKFTVIALQDTMRESLKTKFPSVKVEVINNGIDFEKFSIPSTEEKIQLRETFGLTQKCWVLGNTSRFNCVKNHELIINIFEKLHKENNDSKLVLLGDGPRKNILKALVMDKGLQDNVIWLENRVDVENILKIMDAFIITSRSEGLSFALLEAQCVGLLSFASDVIPRESEISNLVQYISIEQSPEEWASIINNTVIEEVKYFQKEKWDINQIILKMEILYLESRGI